MARKRRESVLPVKLSTVVARVYSRYVKLFQKSKSSVAAAVATRPAPSRLKSRPSPIAILLVMKKRNNTGDTKLAVEDVREETVHINERREVSGYSSASKQKQRRPIPGHCLYIQAKGVRSSLTSFNVSGMMSLSS